MKVCPKIHSIKVGENLPKIHKKKRIFTNLGRNWRTDIWVAIFVQNNTQNIDMNAITTVLISVAEIF